MSMLRSQLSLLLLLLLSPAAAQVVALPEDTLVFDPVVMDTLVIEPLVVDSVPVDGRGSRVKKLLHKQLNRLKEGYSIDSIHSISDVDHILAEKYQKKGTYDTLYLARPTNRFTLKVRMNLSGSGFSTSGMWRDEEVKSKLSSDMRFTTNISLSYRGFSLGFSFNPFKWVGKNTNTELGFNMYNNKYGFDLSYQRTKSHNGWVNVNNRHNDINSSTVTSNVFLATGYYAFNNRRFSYPAIFTQSYIQRRSAGTWLVGASLLAGNLEATKDEELGNPPVKLRLGYIGIGGGYAYNWVINPQWMVHISVLPNLVIGSFNKITIDGYQEKIRFAFPQFIMTERLAVLYCFRYNMFTGLSFVAYNTLLANYDNMRLNYRRWRLELSYGLLF